MPLVRLGLRLGLKLRLRISQYLSLSPSLRLSSLRLWSLRLWLRDWLRLRGRVGVGVALET